MQSITNYVIAYWHGGETKYHRFTCVSGNYKLAEALGMAWLSSNCPEAVERNEYSINQEL